MIRIARLRLISCAVVASLWLSAAVTAVETDGMTSPADRSLHDSVWYDAESQKVVPVHVKPIVDDSLHRESRWLPKAARIEAAAAPAAGGGGSGLFGSGMTIGNLFGWLLLFAIIVAAIGGLAYALSKAEVDVSGNPPSIAGNHSRLPDEQTIQRMKHLPAELRRLDVNLRSEAERLMKEGRFDQAIILLFGHQLLLLDQVGMLRLNRGKTNRKYVRETRSLDADAANQLHATVTAFERSYFGRHVISRSEFEALWLANSELERAADRRPETAA